MKRKNLLFGCLALAGILNFSNVVNAQNFKTSPLFQAGMVLQYGMEVPIWGTADAGAKVKAEWNGIESSEAVADENGKWKVIFPSTNYGGPYEMNFSVNGEVAKTYKDVYFGEVFYCSGQSNMELEVRQCNDYEAVKTAATDNTIRQMKIAKGVAYEPTDELPTVTWRPTTPNNVGNFSAAAYFFVLELKKLDAYKDMPIGILNNSYGGARVEAWMSKEMLGYDEQDVVLAAGEDERQPTKIFNKMVNPLIGLPFKAMLWYQAESNCDGDDDAKLYSQQFSKMITSYRELWGIGDFPVIWVQLPNYISEVRSTKDNEFIPTSTPQASHAWVTMRNEQTKCLSLLSNSAQIITIDAGLAGNIHPTDKQTIGARLALAARKLVYGEAINGYSPDVKSYVVNENGSVTISFDNIGEGLVCQEYVKTEDSKIVATPLETNEIKWFSVLTESGKLKYANAVLADNKVTVSCDEKIAAIRYAWDRCPGGLNLYGKVGDLFLPVGPFYIDLQPAEFGIVDFTSSEGKNVDENPLTVEGGTFVTFSWKTGGDATVYLNDERVDANASAKFLMTEDCEYTLKVVDNQNPENVEQSKISFHVIPPKPRINLNSVSGILANPGDEMEIETNATAPGGFEVTKVELFLGDEQIATLTEIPFTYKWTAAENLGEYKFSGIVYNNNDDFAKSDTLTLIVTDQKKVRFEAEKAILVDSDAGGSAATNDETCSGGKYMALHDFVTLTFKNIYAPEAGEYPIYIKYMCNFEAPKRQSISVNGVSYGEIEFTSETWDIYKMTLPLDKGMNTITIGASWKWMSFDYIDILGVEERALGELSADLGNFASPNETFKINVNATVPEGKTLEKIELYCVGEEASIAEFTELSSVYAWQVPATEGEYTFFARVYVDGEYTQSDNFTVIVTNLSKARFEAEDAVLVGSGGVVNDKNCSNGKYLDVTEFETVTFNGIVAPKDGTYEIFIGYMCNYQAPKGQDLIVNGKQVEGMMFESTVWSVYTTKVPLKEGENTIQIKASWKWMSFDYIDILGVTKKETVAVPSIENSSSSMTAFGNEYSSITVKYDTEARLVSFDVFDMNGHSVAKASTAGENGEFAFNQSLRAGVYVVKMTAGNEVVVQQVMVK